MRAVILCAVTACSFHRFDAHGAMADAPDGVVADAPSHADAAIPFCDPREATLVACYEFEGSGADGSMYGNNADAASILTFAPGHRGQAYASTDTSDFRVTASTTINVAGTASIELWVSPSMLADVWLLDDDNDYGVHMNAMGIVNCAFAGMTPDAAATAALPVGTWTHLACTFDGTTNRLYVNGTLSSTSTVSGNRNFGDAFELALGHDSPTGAHLHGSIDSVRIYKGVRSASEIAAAAAL